MARRFQFSLKTLLVLMLLAGVAAWGYIQVRRSIKFSALAEKARTQAEGFKGAAAVYANQAATGWTTRPNGQRKKLSSSEKFGGGSSSSTDRHG